MDFMTKLEELLSPIVNSVWVYLITTILSWLMGGFDKALLSLILLNVIDFIAYLLSKSKREGIVISKLKIYLVIILGVIMDRIFGLDTNESVRLRNYLVFAYSYNEVVSILKVLALDEGFYIPNRLRNYIKNLEEKVDDKEAE